MKSSITFSSEDVFGAFLVHQLYPKMRQMRTTLPRPTTGCRKISDDCTFHFLIENDHTRGVVTPAFAAMIIYSMADVGTMASEQRKNTVCSSSKKRECYKKQDIHQKVTDSTDILVGGKLRTKINRCSSNMYLATAGDDDWYSIREREGSAAVGGFPISCQHDGGPN